MSRREGAKSVSLALQGGGAHGAFTWGVLDRLLQDERLVVSGITGTSAGAMNAVVLASGLAKGDPEEARHALTQFWRDVSRDGRMSPLQRTAFDRLMGNWSLARNPAYLAFEVASRFFSPYDFNPLNINPLREILEAHVDFEALRQSQVKIFISATNVHTGRARIFGHDEMTADAVMASACLPFLFQAVEIDGVPYWDGGYMGNPPLFPLYEKADADDIILVQINPVMRETTPRTASEIQNRINEITFNASLLSQLRAIDHAAKLIDQGLLSRWTLGGSSFRRVRLHRIGGEDQLVALDATSKMNAEWTFLQHLRDLGRAAAEVFLETHFDDLGRRSTLDLKLELAD
ncbi:patatin-like phospholipase family protein [Xanthobacter autotrophicus]|uniref:Patatin-like phospholipase family protein n=1 Tax=Xanthobacter autotrophicus TaxID=280 RepID=A0A6C1KSZ9_XANAU|nr:patatin-like phospholipase family protein [Xanthobacter autotrophicus]TLX41923.1 patatin-like phospholipase family protein [Xanthobacter autotrophicus]